MLIKIAFNEDFWIHAIWINFLNIKKAKWGDVNYFMKRYQILFDEFQDFNSMGEYGMDLSGEIWMTYDDDTNGYRMDTVWYGKK